MRQTTNKWVRLRSGLAPLLVLWLGMITTTAATPASPGAGGATPMWGIVVKEDAMVRSGAGTSYITGKLVKGSFVQIKKTFQGWYKIVPPKGSYSYISKAFVNARGDGGSGVINRNRAAVKAVNLQDKGNSYRTQVSLIKGTKVQILGEYGSYYMVAPPQGAHVYVRASAVMSATKAQLRTAGLLQDKTAPPQRPAKPAAAKPQSPSPAVHVQPVPPTKPNTRPAPQLPPAPTVAVSPPPPVPPVPPAPPVQASHPVSEPVIKAVATEPKPEPKVQPLPKVKVIVIPEVEPALGSVGKLMVGRASRPSSAGTADPPPQSGVFRQSLAPEPVEQPLGEQPPEPAEQPVSKQVAAAQTQPMSLDVAEQRYRLVSKLKLDQQPVDELLAAYRAIQRTPLTAAQREKVELRISILRRRAILADTLARITRSRRQSQAVLAPVSVGHAKPAPVPDHVGYLLLSGVYDGVHQPRLYRLVDQTTRRTIAYIRPSKAIDSRIALGKVVRIQGAIALSEQLRRNVLTVDRLQVVAPPATMTIAQ